MIDALCADQIYHFSLEVINQFIFDDVESVAGISVSSRGQYAGSSTPSLVSRPVVDKDDWSSFWHPIFGTCFAFKPANPIIDYVGQAGIDFVKVDLDFSVAFPVEPVAQLNPEPTILSVTEKSINNELQTEDSFILNTEIPPDLNVHENESETTTFSDPANVFPHYPFPPQFSPDNFRIAISLSPDVTEIEPGDGELVVVAFDQGRFLTSQEIAIVTREKNEYYTLDQEIIDKTATQDIANCSDYTNQQQSLVNSFR